MARRPHRDASESTVTVWHPRTAAPSASAAMMGCRCQRRCQRPLAAPACACLMAVFSSSLSSSLFRHGPPKLARALPLPVLSCSLLRVLLSSALVSLQNLISLL